MKYEVGDKVRVRSDLVVGDRYDAWAYVSDMSEFSGKEVIIEKVRSESYNIKGDPDKFGWTDSMLDKIKPKTKKAEDLKYPDVVHCSSVEQYDKITSFIKLVRYNGDQWYLTDAHGKYHEPYDEESSCGYVNYEFSDIIFPEEKVVEKIDEEFKVGAYIVFINNFGGSDKGDIDKIISVSSPEAIYLNKEGLCWGRLGTGFNEKCKYFLTLKEAQEFSDELLSEGKVDVKMSKEELIEEAKRRYPIGTKILSAYHLGSNAVVNGYDIDGKNIHCINSSGGRYGFIYFDGKWAEIVSESRVERLSFYVRYDSLFTKDLYDKLMEWSIKNNPKDIRGFEDNYNGLKNNGYFIYNDHGFGGSGSLGYGVDNNRQNCINEYSIQQVKELIGYNQVEEYPDYVKCVDLSGGNPEGIELNKVYKVLSKTYCSCGTGLYLLDGINTNDDNKVCIKCRNVVKWNAYGINRFKPSTKEAFDKQNKPVIQEKEELVQTKMAQGKACTECKYRDSCATKGFSCNATGGQHYPKDYIAGNRTDGYMDGVNIPDRPLIHAGNIHEWKPLIPLNKYHFGIDPCYPPLGGIANIGMSRHLYDVPHTKEECSLDSSGDIIVNIKKTKVKQIKL